MSLLRATSLLAIALGCTTAHAGPADEESLPGNLIAVAADGTVSCTGPAFEFEAQVLDACVSGYDRSRASGPVVIQADRHALTGDVLEVVSQTSEN
jgi:biopolymer transport protein ExbD